MTGPSQDELCLINMAAQTGICEFIDRNSAVITIKVQGKIEEYRNVKFYDFTSARKMMSRVVQNIETGRVLALVKGADSAILSRCVPSNLAHLPNPLQNQGKLESFNNEEKCIVDEIERFAAKGFRTLTFGMKELDSPDMDGFRTQEDIECCLTLLGASCVEDLLQKDVRQCLIDYKRAGIQTWMLTGDKGKTAKMIGLQCGMFSVSEKSPQFVKNHVGTTLHEI